MTPDPHPPEATTPAWRILVPAGIVEMVCLTAAAWWPGGASAYTLLPLFAVAFAAYALAGSRVLRLRGGHVLVWVFAVAMRLVLLPLLPDLSHDVYRYLWDGQVQLAGINPFRYAPTDPILASIRTPWFGLLPDPGELTTYPPMAQIAFAVLAMAGGAVLQAKLLWVALDLTAGWILGRIAAFTGRSRRLTQLLYLWSPLLLIEVAWNGHLAPLVVLGVCLVILLARAPAAAGFAAAAASLSAWAPAAALIPLSVRLGRRFFFAFVGGAVVLCLPYVMAGTGIFRGVMHHFGAHRFFEGPFLLLESVTPGGTVAHWIAAAVVLGVIIWTAVERLRPERAIFWTLGAVLLLTPALRPWYVLWILPLAALRVSRPWLLLSGTVLATYAGTSEFRATGLWPQSIWVQLVVWLPFAALLIREAHLAWRARFPLSTQQPG